MEGDGVHGPGVDKQNRHHPRVDHGVPGRSVQPGVDPGVLIDEQSVAVQALLLEQVLDNIPGEIHQFMDRRLHCWSGHESMVLLGTDRFAEKARSVSEDTPAPPAPGRNLRRGVLAQRVSSMTKVCPTGGRRP